MCLVCFVKKTKGGDVAMEDIITLLKLIIILYFIIDVKNTKSKKKRK